MRLLLPHRHPGAISFDKENGDSQKEAEQQQFDCILILSLIFSLH